MTAQQHAACRVVAFLVVPMATIAVCTTVAALDSAAFAYRLLRRR